MPSPTDIATSAPNVKQAVPFFAVADILASLRFYVDGLGFTMTHQWIDEGVLRWCWLQLDGAALMLQQFRREGLNARVPPLDPGAGVTICFQCADALLIYREAAARGLLPSRPFVGNSMWVTSFSDPDGYKLSFQSPTDAPEETLLPHASCTPPQT